MNTEKFESMPLPTEVIHEFTSWFESVEGYIITAHFLLESEKDMLRLTPNFLQFKDGPYVDSKLIEIWDNPTYIDDFLNNIYHERWDKIIVDDVLSMEFYEANQQFFAKIYIKMVELKDIFRK
jgi:hypothetical protein